MASSDRVRQIRHDLTHGDRAEREAAVGKIDALPSGEREQLADDLVAQLETDLDVWPRAWTVSALAAIGREEDWAELEKWLTDETTDPWVRYWAAVGFVEHDPGRAPSRLSSALDDEDDPLVRSVMLRSLIDLEPDSKAAEQRLRDLLTMLGNPSDWDERWTAAKAFRSHGIRKPLPSWAQVEAVPALAERMAAERGSDVCEQAALALGSMNAEWEKALGALSEVLGDPGFRSSVRRAAMDALAELSREEAAGVLADALVDVDAEIRAQAARILVEVVGVPSSVQLVVDRLVAAGSDDSEPLTSRGYLQALRDIDVESAGRQISAFASHPDPEVADRATIALRQLGGASAFATLHNQRREMLDSYTEMLSNADVRTTERFQELMAEARKAFETSMWMHRIVFGIGAASLAAGLVLSLVSGLDDFARFVGVGAAASGVAMMLAHFYKDPLRNIEHSLLALLRVTVVFQGFVRQVNQADATFKQRFLASGSQTDLLEPSLEALRSSVSIALDEIDAHLVTDGAPASPPPPPPVGDSEASEPAAPPAGDQASGDASIPEAATQGAPQPAPAPLDLTRSSAPAD